MTSVDETIGVAVPTGIALTPLDENYRNNPDAVLDVLRARDPMHYDAVLKRWLLARHDDVDALLRDRTLSADPRNGAEGTFMTLFGVGFEDREPSILFLDPPRHTHLRGLVSKAFTPRALEAITPRIQQIVDELLDAVTGARST